MTAKYLRSYIIFMMLVSVLTNAFGWAFSGEVFAHELDHEHPILSLDPMLHLKAHQHDSDKDSSQLDAATHLCLHASGQYQPFYFTALLLVPASVRADILAVFISDFILDSISKPPLRPPKDTFAS
ncbi:MAG: hypothetical protein E4H07_04340 [Nitrosomonadales bacterium]|nr:MAG: hypothetical protein E4H07_04340 [Nitrosomonadales bacterium]